MQTPERRAQRFGPDRRLRRRSEFQRVFDAGRRIQGRYLTVLALPNGSGTTRLGIVASRRLGDAIRRNRAKRRVRELFRTLAPREIGMDLVVIPRRELVEAPHPAIERDFTEALRRSAPRRSPSGGA